MSDDNDKMSWGVHSPQNPLTPPEAAAGDRPTPDYADLAARLPGAGHVTTPGSRCRHPYDMLLGEVCPRCSREILAVLRDEYGRNLPVTEDDLPGLVDHAAYLMRQVVQLSVGRIRDEVAAQAIRDVELEDEVLLEDEAEELMREVQSDG